MIEHCPNPIIDSEEDNFTDVESYGEWIDAIVGCDVLSEDVQPQGGVIDSISDFSVFFTDCTTSQEL